MDHTTTIDVNRELGLRFKRLADIVASLLTLLVAAPLLAVVCVIIRLDSPGAAMFVQTRVGYRGRLFRMYKLRTMVSDAEARLPALQAAAGLSGPVFKMDDDPRITRVGKWLRRSGLDELPQVINVLIGDMSLVGPRPLPPSQVDNSDSRFIRRTDVRPGLTGLWQVNGRSMHVHYDRWLSMDVEYVERLTPMLDLEILLRTVPAIIKGEGAV